MRRRDLLRGAALAGVSVALPSASSITKPETTYPKQLGKIAMEEHFMVPDFMEYFAETYPNINGDIAKLAPGALMDFGERRLAVMDEHHVEYVVLSLAGPGVQAEMNGTVAQRKARALNDFLAGEIQKRPARYGGFAHLAVQNRRKPPRNSNAACATSVFTVHSSTARQTANTSISTSTPFSWSVRPRSMRPFISIRATR
jgi:hypothetical protein